MIDLGMTGDDPLAGLESDVRARVDDLLMAVADRIAAGARDRLPLGSALGAAIAAEGDGDAVQVTAAAPYAAFVEFGTSRNAARPFLGPAVFDWQGRVMEALS